MARRSLDAAQGALLGATAGILWGAAATLGTGALGDLLQIGNEALRMAFARFLPLAGSPGVDTPARLFLLHILLFAAAGALLAPIVRLVFPRSGASEQGALTFALLLAIPSAAWAGLSVSFLRLPAPRQAGLLVALGLLAPGALLAVRGAALLAWRAGRRAPWGIRGWGTFVASAAAAGSLLLRLPSLTVLPAEAAPAAAWGKVVLVGLDGADWDLIERLSRAGQLPTFRRLLSEGARGDLRSLLPPIRSPVVWTTLSTGRPARVHGIRDFVVEGNGGRPVPVSARLKRVPDLWEMTDRMGLSAVVVGWWPSWPAAPLRGALITDRAWRPGIPARTYPAELAARVDALRDSVEAGLLGPLIPGGPLADFRDLDGARALPPDHPARVVHELIGHYAVRDHTSFVSFLRLWQAQRPDLAALYLQGIDRLQHKVWKYSARRWSPLLAASLYRYSPEEIALLDGALERYYRYVDGLLEEIFRRAGPEDLVLIISDHGAGPRWEITPRPRLTAFGTLLREVVSEALPGAPPPRWRRDVSDNFKIFVEVPLPDARRDPETLAKAFRALRTEGGRPLFLRARIAEGRAARDHTVRLHLWLNVDVLARGDRIRLGGEPLPLEDVVSSTIKSGNHRINGILLASGKGIAPGRRVRGATVFDVVPTVLYGLGLPVGRDMEGKVLGGLFTRDHLRQRPVRLGPPYTQRPDPKAIPQRSAADGAILDELRALGYIN